MYSFTFFGGDLGQDLFEAIYDSHLLLVRAVLVVVFRGNTNNHAILHELGEAHAANPIDHVIALFTKQLKLNLSVSILPHIDGIVDHVVLEVEPQDTVVGLRV